MLPAIFGRTYYPADIRYTHPLWYDGVHKTRNYDLVDAYTMFYPNSRFFNEGLKLGEIRTWNPYILCGHPMFAAGGTGVLYPPSLLCHFLFQPTTAHDIILGSHLLAAGFFFYLFLCRLGLGSSPAMYGGTLWMLNGFTMTWFESEFSIIYGALAALVMERLTVAFSGPLTKPVPALTAALVMGVLCLAGHAQFWANFMLLFACWTFYLRYRFILSKDALWVPIVLGLPLFVGAVSLLPILELAARTARPDRDFSIVIESFRNAALSLPLTLVSPEILGSPVQDFALKFVSPRGNWLMLETCCYLGVAALGLLALSYRERREPYWKFFAALAVGLILVPSTPLFFPFFKLVPGFSKVAPTRLLFQWVFSLSVLSGFGAQALLKSSLHGRKRLARGMLTLAVLWATLGIGFSWSQSQQPEKWVQLADWLISSDRVRYPFPELSLTPEQFRVDVLHGIKGLYRWSSPAFLTPLVWAGLCSLAFYRVRKPERLLSALLLITVLDLGSFATRFCTTSTLAELSSQPQAFTYLNAQPGPFRVLGLGTIRPNTSMLFDVATLEGQDALTSQRTLRLLDALASDNIETPTTAFSQIVFPIENPNSPLVHVTGARYLLAYPQVDLHPLGFHPVFQQSPQGHTVWENPRAHPIVRMAPFSISAQDSHQALLEAARLAESPQTVVVESPAKQGTSRETPTIVRRTPGHWTIDATGPGWLVLLESHDPGWSALVDGRPTAIAPAQSAFQAVWLESGKHQVQWDYSPPRFLLGLRLSLFGIAAIILALAGLGWLRRRG